jgi:hypothetical protein
MPTHDDRHGYGPNIDLGHGDDCVFCQDARNIPIHENTWAQVRVDSTVPEGMIRIDGRDFPMPGLTPPSDTIEILGPATPVDPNEPQCAHRWRDVAGSRSGHGTMIRDQECTHCRWRRMMIRDRSGVGWTASHARRPVERPAAVTDTRIRVANPDTCDHNWLPCSPAYNSSGDYWQWTEQCGSCRNMRLMACTGSEHVPPGIRLVEGQAPSPSRGGRATMITHDEAILPEFTMEYMNRMERTDTPFLRATNPMGWNYQRQFLQDYPPMPDHRPDPYINRRRRMLAIMERSDAYRNASPTARAEMLNQASALCDFERQNKVLEEVS